MFNKDDKRRLYWLIEMYLLGKIDSNTFDDEFYYSYGLEIDRDLLSKPERDYFHKLYQISSRCSPFEEDHKVLPRVYYTEADLKRQVLETKEVLKFEAPLYKILFEVKDELPEQDVNKVVEFIENFDWISALETICIQLYQHHIQVSEKFYESISDFGKNIGVDPFICLLLKDLVLENHVKK